MEAIEPIKDISIVKRERCIGCGNCVANCPSDAISLKKKDKQYVPQLTMDDLFDRIMQRKKAQR